MLGLEAAVTVALLQCDVVSCLPSSVRELAADWFVESAYGRLLV